MKSDQKRHFLKNADVDKKTGIFSISACLVANCSSQGKNRVLVIKQSTLG
jgi:hypothetical protein